MMLPLRLGKKFSSSKNCEESKSIPDTECKNDEKPSSSSNQKVRSTSLRSSSHFMRASDLHALNRLNAPAVNCKTVQSNRLNDARGSLSLRRHAAGSCNTKFCRTTLNVKYNLVSKQDEASKTRKRFKQVVDKSKLNHEQPEPSESEQPKKRFKTSVHNVIHGNTIHNYYKHAHNDRSIARKGKLCEECPGTSSSSLEAKPSPKRTVQETQHAPELMGVSKINHSVELTESVPSTSNDESFLDMTSDNIFLSTKPEKDFANEQEDNYFGLFGISSVEFNEEAIFSFDLLPSAVVELILCQIPFKDMLSLRCVCKAWNIIISNQKFAEWKKMYFRFKWTNDIQSSFPEEISSVLLQCNVNDCFPTLIRYMTCTFNRRAPVKMMDVLKTLPKYDVAVRVIAERLPDLATKAFNPWGVISVMALISETVEDMMTIIKHLSYNGSPCSLHDVIDAIYCIATFLLYFKNSFKVNHGIHYRVYYALYLWENSISRNKLSIQNVTPQIGIYGQQSMHNYCKPIEQRLTYEQIRILNHRLKPNQVIKIVAFAGSGKTSTLVHFARVYPQLKFLNVVFNKGVCDYASKCFPSNVECRTAHSLAYQAVGKKYHHKLAFKLKPYDILSYLNKPKEMNMHVYTYARCVLQTVQCFMMSSDEEITIAHVPQFSMMESPSISRLTFRERLSDSERLNFRKEAAELWEKMVDPDNSMCKITHDTYLKVFQLSKPKFKKYKCIMIDEAQDCNDAMLDIMLSQKDVPVILVGDPHQQIYGFRGANNALEQVQATHTYHLTKSFRFGPEIAYIASCCIEVLKRHKRTTLIGCEKSSYVDGKVKGQYAVIARTNFRLYEEAVRLCCSNVRRKDEPKDIHAAFAGGITGYGFDQLVDIYRLSSGEEKHLIKDKFVKKFATLRDLSSYAKKAEDSDLLGKIDLVLQYGYKIMEHVKTIKKKGSSSMELANVVFSTAHKSKGLEFDTVCLTDDFHISNQSISVSSTEDPSMSEECNILYVALTRAKQCLLMSEVLYRVLLGAQEKFEYPVSSKEVLQDFPFVKCVKCSTEFTPHTVLTSVRRNVMLAARREISGGPLCIKCSTMPFYRPEVHQHPAIVILDRVVDSGHRSMSSLVGPLPSDPPIQYDDDDDVMFHLEEHEPFIFHINVMH